jgi:hypothetical protein
MDRNGRVKLERKLIQKIFSFDAGFVGPQAESDRRATPIVFGPRIRISCTGRHQTSACAAFIKESRIKFANASKLDRKSGVRYGERGAPVLFPVGPL